MESFIELSRNEHGVIINVGFRFFFYNLSLKAIDI